MQPDKHDLEELRKVVMSIRRKFPAPRLDVMVRMCEEARKLPEDSPVRDMLIRAIESGLNSLVTG